MTVSDAVGRSGGSQSAAGQAGASRSTAGRASPASADEGQAPSVRLHFPLWFAIHHRADDGARVRLGLRREGWEVHWPREVHRVPRRDDTLRPLLPGYMFARPISRRASWSALKGSVPNLIAVCGVREFGQPSHPPRGFVEALIARAGGAIDGVIQPKEDQAPVAAWEEGLALRFTDGAMWGVHAILKADRGDRVDVLFSLFGRESEVTVDRQMVEPRE